ncbi:c-type cytochrome [Akkermansiaceae bacterium]|nr:c-type cytochrome [Akkermansiaceae bacterium]
MKTFRTLGLALVIATPLIGDEAPITAKKIATETQKKLENRTLYFRGLRTFERMCVQCHGRTGRGNGPWAETMTNKPRNLRTGTFKFRTTPYGKLPSDSDLRRTIRSGISGTAMPTFAKMSDSEIEGIVTYVQSLSRRWQDDTNYAVPIKLPDPPAWFKDLEKINDHVVQGQTLFAKTCASCHGPSGKGDGPASKGLIDVWERPITPANLSEAHYKSGDSPADLFRTISTGLDGTPMVGFHGALKPEEIWNLVAHVRSLRKK